MTVTTVAWLVGGAGVLFLCWEARRRLRAGAAHIRHCIDTFEPRPAAGPPAPAAGPESTPRSRPAASHGGTP
ncbi:hypothetical protein AB4Z39_04930 [Mycobacterium adipatum]|uniref:hypothetical protein n=1 Tax=Mycobacterium adipatum TaxID=1682113 RepID=UPI0034E07A3B